MAPGQRTIWLLLLEIYHAITLGLIHAAAGNNNAARKAFEMARTFPATR
jgi:hypothetical protein